MNKEVMKVIEKKKKNEAIMKIIHKKKCKANHWWYKNKDKITRIIIFPVHCIDYLKDVINEYLDKKQTWNENRAIEILNYYVPRYSDWDEKNKCFYFSDTGMGWHIWNAKKYLRRKDRRFWKVYSKVYGGAMRDFLINNFQLSGFTKHVYECMDAFETYITFTFNPDGD